MRLTAHKTINLEPYLLSQKYANQGRYVTDKAVLHKGEVFMYEKKKDIYKIYTGRTMEYAKQDNEMNLIGKLPIEEAEDYIDECKEISWKDFLR